MDASNPTSPSINSTENKEVPVTSSTVSTPSNKINIPYSFACPNCIKIVSTVRDWQAFRKQGFGARVWIASRESFRATAKDCRTCAKLDAHFESFPWYRFKDKCGVALGLVKHDDGDQLMIGNQCEHSHSITPLFLPQALGSEHQHYIQPNPENINLAQIQSWLARCDSEHGLKCYVDHSFSYRLLFIDVHDLCLVVGDSEAKYTALSYVWGKEKSPFQTIKSNLEELLRPGSLSREWKRLPPTVQDAILLSKQLQVGYIWIDRLCIVQDDEASKAQNIAAMASIYSQSYFTIVAADGNGPEFGLRGTGTDSGPRASQNELYEDVLAFEDLEFLIADGKLYADREQIWHSRAWTFQERVVARRCLIFNHGVVKLECQTGLFHEKLALFEKYSDGSYRLPRNPWPDRYQYNRLAQEYTTRALSYQSDALNAFSAILDVLTPSFPGGFVWGLPVFFLDTALDWTHLRICTRREEFPSWSFLGWQGQIEMSRVWAADPRARLLSIPMGTTWKMRDKEEGKLKEIKLDHYDKWERYENVDMEEPPESWERVWVWGNSVKKNVPRYKYIPKEEDDREYPESFAYPVPIAPLTFVPAAAAMYEPYLYVTTPTATFTLGEPMKPTELTMGRPLLVFLHDPSTQGIAGIIETNFEQRTQYALGDECLLIALYHGQTNHVSWVPIEYRGYANEMETKNPVSNEVSTWDWVQVLWVELKGQIAYRRGTGRVWFRAWMNVDATRSDIILG